MTKMQRIGKKSMKKQETILGFDSDLNLCDKCFFFTFLFNRVRKLVLFIFEHVTAVIT